jgi:DNA-binding NarL/FixJ family response regulator
MVRIIIAEDHIVLRQGLRLLLEQSDDFLVVGEASNGAEALDILARTPADVVLMDVNMPVIDGYEATRQVRLLYPNTKVIALSMHNNMPYVQKMLECGASGYLLKTSTNEELSAAVKLVASGTRYISSDLSVQILEQNMKPETEKERWPGEDKGLSKREVEVLTLVAEGLTNAEIADKLFTSRRTIETHRQNIMEKTKAKNTPNLIKYAIENNIIRFEGQK